MEEDKIKHSLYISRLIENYLCSDSNEISGELKQWLDSSDEHRIFFEELLNGTSLSERLNFYDKIDIDANWGPIKKRLTKRNKINWWRWASSIAASIIVIMAVGYYFSNKPKEIIKEKPQIFTGAGIMPGSSKAMLISGNQRIVLKKSTNIQTKNGLLTNGNVSSANRLIVPCGGIYTFQLEDGTKVWMNSNSKLTFPAHFAVDKREIRLSGEAYFEVAKNAKCPFYVYIDNNVAVRVTGTSFNVRKYADEPNLSVSLISGKVQMEKNNKLITKLVPMKEFDMDTQTQNYKIEDISMEKVLAWKNNEFVFDNEPLFEIAKELSRWYNIKINVDPHIKDNVYSGVLNRQNSIKNIIDVLTMTDEIEFVKDPDKGVLIIPIRPN
jgi:ferric-dicitrate binding protein FerR (iron transport regulator)